MSQVFEVCCGWHPIAVSSLCPFLTLVYIIGVVETGLFVNMAVRIYFGQADGTVEVLRSQRVQ